MTDSEMIVRNFEEKFSKMSRSEQFDFLKSMGFSFKPARVMKVRAAKRAAAETPVKEVFQIGSGLVMPVRKRAKF